jgi:hypothetical protein
VVPVLIGGVSDQGINSHGDTDAWNVLRENNMDRGGDAARDMVVYTVPRSVTWIPDHDAAKCLFAQLTT